MGSINGRIMVQVSPGINARPYWKTNYRKKGWGMAHVVEQQSSKCKALSNQKKLLFFFFWRQVLLYNPGCPQTLDLLPLASLTAAITGLCHHT
jgi:hypothetical protein